jgi:hypothetical protein
VKYTKENIVDGIYAKLDRIFGSDPMYKGVCEMFKVTLPEYPKEIEQNVLEWVNDEPFSEIDCHGISVKHVVEIKNLSDAHMPQVFENFITFQKNGFEGNAVCYWWL